MEYIARCAQGLTGSKVPSNDHSALLPARKLSSSGLGTVIPNRITTSVEDGADEAESKRGEAESRRLVLTGIVTRTPSVIRVCPVEVDDERSQRREPQKHEVGKSHVLATVALELVAVKATKEKGI
jgi:hypothetical protein